MAKRIEGSEAVYQRGSPDAGKGDEVGTAGGAEVGVGRTLPPTVYAAAGLAFAAALIHLWATPEHFEEWWGYGAFFVAAATGQGIFGVALLRGFTRPLLLLAGIWANAAIVVLYVVTRTRGIPLGPHDGTVEDAGVADMAATAAEVGMIVALVMLLGGAYRRWTLNALLLLGVVLWVLRLTGVLIGP